MQEPVFDWQFDLEEEAEPIVVVYNNTCYICHRKFVSTEESEICSDVCLKAEELLPSAS